MSKNIGRKNEKQTSRRLNAKLTPGSGATATFKGDMTFNNYLVECKATENNSLSLKLEWLGKISREALEVGKKPLMTITFTDDTGRPRRHGAWVLVPETEFKELNDV